MLKKITTLTLAVFLLVAFNNALAAQDSWSQFSDDVLKTITQYAPMFEGQTAITEADIKKYIELLPALMEAENDPEKIQDLMSKNKMDSIRYSYIAMKIPIALLINEKTGGWLENADKLPAVLNPSKEEIALAVKYMGDIENAATN